MIILKIVGILLLAIIVLLMFILSLRIRIIFDYSTQSEAKFYIGVLFFKFRINKPDKPKKEKKEKKQSKFILKLKKLFGVDVLSDSDSLKQNTEETGISSTVSKVITAVSLIAGEAVWLLKRFKLHHLRFSAVCGGGDAADAAMDYGLVCSTVYPFAGYLDATLKTKKNAQDIRIYCDFENDSSFEFYIYLSVRTIHIVRALLRNLTSEEAKINEQH